MKPRPLSLVVLGALLGIASSGCIIDRRPTPTVTPRPVASADGRNPFSRLTFPIVLRPPSRPAPPQSGSR